MQNIFEAHVNFTFWLEIAGTEIIRVTHTCTQHPQHFCLNFMPFSSCYLQQKPFSFLSLPNSICCVYVSTHKCIIPLSKISAFSFPFFLSLFFFPPSFLSFSLFLSLFLLLRLLTASLSFLPLPFLFSLSINRESNSSRLIC